VGKTEPGFAVVKLSVSGDTTVTFLPDSLAFWFSVYTYTRYRGVIVAAFEGILEADRRVDDAFCEKLL